MYDASNLAEDEILYRRVGSMKIQAPHSIPRTFGK